MTLCPCGKPANHGGMCPVRWKVRKANNGPSGLKAKAAPREADAVCKAYGDLADDVLLLRSRGHLVAWFKGKIRVDSDVLTDDQVRERARALRAVVARPAPKLMKESCGIVESRHEEYAGKASAPPPVRPQREAGVAPGPQDLPTRIARIEQQLDRLFDIVAEAIKGRRETLVDQARGLAELETTLRTNV